MDSSAVTVALLPTPVIVPALLSPPVLTVPPTAGALAGTAHRTGSQGARQLGGGVLGPLGPAAALQTILLPPTVALLPLLHHTVAADGDLRCREAALRTQRLGCEHLVDAAETARRELLVVVPVPRGGPGVHDVVPVLSPRHTVLVSLRVVRGPEVVTHLVSHGHVGHGGGDRLAVVHESDDARVETLVAAPVVLSKTIVIMKYSSFVVSHSPRASHKPRQHS